MVAGVCYIQAGESRGGRCLLYWSRRVTWWPVFVIFKQKSHVVAGVRYIQAGKSHGGRCLLMPSADPTVWLQSVVNLQLFPRRLRDSWSKQRNLTIMISLTIRGTSRRLFHILLYCHSLFLIFFSLSASGFRRCCKIARDYEFRNVCLSVHMEDLGSQWTDFDETVFFEYLSRKFKFHWNPTRITGTLHEDFSHYDNISLNS
jgi:hypothetical protein